MCGDTLQLHVHRRIFLINWTLRGEMGQETSQINQSIKVVKENCKGSLLMFELIHKLHTLSVFHTSIFNVNG